MKSLVPPPPMDTQQAGSDGREEFTVSLPDGSPIKAYTDSLGRIVTYHGSAPGEMPRLFEDVFIEAVRRMRSRDGPQPPPLPDSSVVLNNADELQEPDVMLDTKSLKESSVSTTSSFSPQAAAVAHDASEDSPPSGRLPLGSPILCRRPYDWQLVFFIRKGHGESFHIYPHIGGPYQSLDDADNAITHYLDDQREKNLCLDGLSRMEISVRRALYLPDGTRRILSESNTTKESRKNMRLLVQALVDQYNEDHRLVGNNPAYELKDIMCIQSICEGRPHKWYYHLNFTARTKGGSGSDNLFFAEITRIGGAYKEFALSCLYMLKQEDNGHCRGCTNDGSVNLKHPNEADEYTGGHLDPYLPYGGETPGHRISSSFSDNLDVEDEARLKAEEDRLHVEEEERLRRTFGFWDNPSFLAKMRTRFKDDPRAETFFQPRKGVDHQHATPLTESNGRLKRPDAAAPSYLPDTPPLPEKKARMCEDPPDTSACSSSDNVSNGKDA